MIRMGGGAARSGSAPLVSLDGQLILYTLDVDAFEVGDLYTVRSMAGLPEVPAGLTVVGRGYRVFATDGAAVVTGSVSVQYIESDVLSAVSEHPDLAASLTNGQVAESAGAIAGQFLWRGQGETLEGAAR